MSEPLHIISLGAGVQSSTMALMAAAGEITPMPSCAIFADTQDEPDSVYKWLDWLETKLPYPVHRVTNGKLSASILDIRTSKKGGRFSNTAFPAFTLSESGEKGMIAGRSCTQDFKLLPIHREIKRLVGIKRCGGKVMAIQWIGISLDEATRMRHSRQKYIQNRYPLIDATMSRHDCLRWMKARGFPTPPRSACVYCPFHNNTEWRRLKKDEPLDFERAVNFERAVTTSWATKSKTFLHRDCVPLDEVDLSTDNERGQGLLAGFNNECEGMCGV